MWALWQSEIQKKEKSQVGVRNTISFQDSDIKNLKSKNINKRITEEETFKEEHMEQ